MDAMEERKAEILRAIVEEYISSATPVGSKTIVESSELSVSAATIRNEMSALEAEGYISQPHTSAGRVPTDLGYRYYVDHLADPGVLAPTQRREVASFFSSAARAMDDLLAETSSLLARITAHASVVVGPGAAVERVRSAQLVALNDDQILAVLVLSDGAIARELVCPTVSAGSAVVAEASAKLNAAWDGARLAELPDVDPERPEAPTDVDRLIAETTAALKRRADKVADPTFVGGVSQLAAEQDAFGSAADAARVMSLLEQHVVLASLMRDLLGPGLTVRIGAENERDDLAECSLVLAPYLVEGEIAGTVGVLGPRRMDYRQAAAAVDAVSRRLGPELTR